MKEHKEVIEDLQKAFEVGKQMAEKINKDY